MDNFQNEFESQITMFLFLMKSAEAFAGFPCKLLTLLWHNMGRTKREITQIKIPHTYLPQPEGSINHTLLVNFSLTSLDTPHLPKNKVYTKSISQSS